jgi:hypothetical protein
MAGVKKTVEDQLRDAQEIIRQKQSRVIGLEKQLREAVRDNDTAEKLRTEIFGLEAYTREPPKWLDTDHKGKSVTGIPLLLCSDWHWGETVDRDQVGGMNAFNRKIGRQRVKILRDA